MGNHDDDNNYSFQILDFRASFFPKRPPIFFVCTIRQVIFKSPSTLFVPRLKVVPDDPFGLRENFQKSCSKVPQATCNTRDSKLNL